MKAKTKTKKQKNKDVTLKNLVVIIKTNTGKYHQVILSETGQFMVRVLISQLHRGKIQVSSQELEGIEFGEEAPDA